MASTASRRLRTSSSRASLRALPMCPWAALAANSAIAGGTFSRVASTWATAAVGGVTSVTNRQRDLMVIIMSSGDGAQSSQTVFGGGSSIALSSALEAPSVARSASSNSTTRQRPSVGAPAARRMSSAGLLDRRTRAPADGRSPGPGGSRSTPGGTCRSGRTPGRGRTARRRTPARPPPGPIRAAR